MTHFPLIEALRVTTVIKVSHEEYHKLLFAWRICPEDGRYSPLQSADPYKTIETHSFPDSLPLIPDNQGFWRNCIKLNWQNYWKSNRVQIFTHWQRLPTFTYPNKGHNAMMWTTVNRFPIEWGWPLSSFTSCILTIKSTLWPLGKILPRVRDAGRKCYVHLKATLPGQALFASD